MIFWENNLQTALERARSPRRFILADFAKER